VDEDAEDETESDTVECSTFWSVSVDTVSTRVLWECSSEDSVDEIESIVVERGRRLVEEDSEVNVVGVVRVTSVVVGVVRLVSDVWLRESLRA
jgi:hypothetical protein